MQQLELMQCKVGIVSAPQALQRLLQERDLPLRLLLSLPGPLGLHGKPGCVRARLLRVRFDGGPRLGKTQTSPSLNHSGFGSRLCSRYGNAAVAAPLPTYLSRVPPAVTPLLQRPVSVLQLLLEPGGLCTGAGGQQGGRGARRTLARREVLPDVCAHAVQAYEKTK